LELLPCLFSHKKKNTSPVQAKKNMTRIAPAKTIPAPQRLNSLQSAFDFPALALSASEGSAFFRCEELRVICGTRGNPDTVAPFRAWRGSRDLVAQSPKFHAPAATLVEPLLV
jgi:hypothetical protein